MLSTACTDSKVMLKKRALRVEGSQASRSDTLRKTKGEIHVRDSIFGLHSINKIRERKRKRRKREGEKRKMSKGSEGNGV